MADLDLKKLEELARAATEADERLASDMTYENAQDRRFAYEELHAAANPATVLELIALARRDGVEGEAVGRADQEGYLSWLMRATAQGQDDSRVVVTRGDLRGVMSLIPGPAPASAPGADRTRMAIMMADCVLATWEIGGRNNAETIAAVRARLQEALRQPDTAGESRTMAEAWNDGDVPRPDPFAAEAACMGSGSEGDDWQTMDTAPKDGTRFESQDRTNYGRRVFTKTYWYVHPSVQAWVTEEIDCTDYEFEPTHWRPSRTTPADPRPDPRDEALREAREALSVARDDVLALLRWNASAEGSDQDWLGKIDQALAKIDAVIGGAG